MEDLFGHVPGHIDNYDARCAALGNVCRHFNGQQSRTEPGSGNDWFLAVGHMHCLLPGVDVVLLGGVLEGVKGAVQLAEL